MTGLFSGFMQELLYDAQSWLNANLLSYLDQIFKIEVMLEQKASTMTSATVSAAYMYIYTLAAALIVLKFLFKGFSYWILWRDGDADASPQGMLIGAFQAVVIIVSFPFLYDIMMDVTVELTTKLMSIFSVSAPGAEETNVLIVILGGATLGIVEMIVMLVYLVLLIVLYVIMLKRGFELLVLRLGIPFACIGLLDSDYGVWKSYIQVFFKTMFTTVIQLVLMSVSMPLINAGHLLLGIAAIATAFSTPLIMQQFLVANGRGGGITQKVYTASMAVRAFNILRGG